jgi:O-antigen ligase
MPLREKLINMFKPDHSFFERLLYFFLIILPATFPFSLRVSSIITVLIFIAWLLNKGYQKIVGFYKNRQIVFFILFLFVIPILSLLYSTDKSLFLVEKRLSLLIFPLVIFSVIIDQLKLKKILYSFVIGCTIAASYSLAKAIGNTELFSSEMTLYTLGISHVYFGLYLCFAIITLTYFLSKENWPSLYATVLVVWIFSLCTILFILGSRMAIISLLLLSFIALVAFIVKTRKWFTALLIAIFPLIIFLFVFLNFENSRNRVMFLFDKSNYVVGDNYWNNIGSRLSSLKCISETYCNNPFFGTGIGDIQQDLNNCNIQLGYVTLVDMNPHNQYLQFLLGVGVIGFGGFLFFILYSLMKGYLTQKTLFLSFIFIFSFCCLTESLLERQQGVMFFSFFYFVLLLSKSEKNEFQNEIQKMPTQNS